MVFARRSGGGARHSLIQSGMPAADPALLGPPEPPDLAFAGDEALPRLQAQIAAHVGVPPERVIVTVGASAAMLVLALRYFRGARVACETPCYQPLAALPGVFGGELRPMPRLFERGWTLEPEDARRALTGGAGPGHVFLTSPHNPTGAVLEPERLVALAAEAENAGGVLLCNDVYQEYAPAAERICGARLAPNVLSIGSLTKAYGLGALRLGWIVLGEGVADERERLEDGAFLDYVDPPTPILTLASRAMEHLAELRAPYERFQRVSKPLLTRWLAETPGVEGTPPVHGLICFPRITGVQDTLKLHEHLVREHDVDVVPGEYFGLPGHVRLGFALEPEALEEALARLSRGLASFS